MLKAKRIFHSLSALLFAFCVKHSAFSVWRSAFGPFYLKYGLVNPNFFNPAFTSGQLMNKFHNKPLR